MSKKILLFLVVCSFFFMDIVKAAEETLLNNIIIKNYNNFTFNKEIYEYDIEIFENEIDLDISAIPVDSSASVRIEGSKHLVDKTGVIKITVSKEGYEDTVYTINYTKVLPNVKQEFTYKNAAQLFKSLYDAKYKIELWGASGRTDNVAAPGKGAYTSGVLEIAKNYNLYFYTGESGNLTSSNYGSLTFNGGGYTHSATTNYGRGGGATDVRLVSGNWNDFNSLKSRIMVAGGGGSGGASNYPTSGHGTATGGDAGGLVSYKGSGVTTTGSLPGTQTSGYQFGTGGPGLTSQAYSASGGGYYGGKSSTTNYCDVTYGGSSFISGHNGCDAISDASSSLTNIVHTGQSVHYSGMTFENTVMIDGKGYAWTDKVGTTVEGMPTHDGTSTMTGNIGNGYAKIELVGMISKNNYLSSLTANKGTWDKEFNFDDEDYVLTISGYESYVKIEALVDDEDATVTELEEIYLENPGDEKDVTITVTASNGDVRNYNIKIKRDEVSEASTKLKTFGITTESYEFDKRFESLVTDYSVVVASSELTLDLEYTLYDDRAKVEIVGNKLLLNARNVLELHVTHPDAQETVYRLTVVKDSKKLKDSITFDYTGNYQEYIAPRTGYYTMLLWGASGRTNGVANPGLGGFTKGTIYLEKDTKLYIYVGESGNITSSNYRSNSFNGGGYTHHADARYGRGGGATDIRLTPGTWNDFNSLKSRIMVAGGGGAPSSSNASIGKANGGAAGGLTSYKGNGIATTGKIATQTSGYAFGYGGPGLASQGFSGSGGGYYGGASSTNDPCDITTGGSSFISGHLGSNAIAESSTSSKIVHTGDSAHYSGYVFNDTVMIDGLGYEWTTEIGEYVGMPTHDEKSTMSGNTGNGYAVIYYPEASKNNYLESIVSNKGNFTEEFDAFKTEYNLVIDTYDSSVNIGAVAYDANATITGTGKYKIKYGETKAIEINVTSESGDVRTYTVNVSRRPLGENEHTSLLSDLVIEGYEEDIIPEFDSRTLEYNLTISSAKIDLNVLAEAYDPEANITITGNELMLDDKGTIKIVVSEPNSETSTYVINYVKTKVLVNYDYPYIGTPQTFIAPITGFYEIELWGASGRNTGYVGAPGLGGYTKGIIKLNKDDILYVYVGESGNITSSNYNQLAFNGGGYTHHPTSYYGRGGGATDIRLVGGTWNDFNSLKSRIMVAGGGGSGGRSNSIGTSVGGAAGGLTSYRGTGAAKSGKQATQTSGYAFGYGGPGLSSQAYSGSGAGYYGGASSIANPCDETYGGSSFISGHLGSNAIAESSTSTNIIHTNQPNHYSGYVFQNTVMIDGLGYSWTTQREDYVGMPTQGGNGIMNGNSGDGYAKIKLVELSSNNYLSDIILKIDDEIRDFGFDPITLTYDITLDASEVEVDIGAKTYEESANVVGTGVYEIKAGTTTVTLSVTAEDGTLREYTLNITRPASTDASLKDIEINKMLPGLCNLMSSYCNYSFDKDTLTYDIMLPWDIEELELVAVKNHKYQSVRYWKIDANNKIELENGNITLDNINTSFEVEVISEAGEQSSTYRYNFTRDENGNNNLKLITISDPDIPVNKFNPKVYEYYISLPGKYTSFTVDATPDNPKATVEVIDSDKFNFIYGLNDVTIRVTAPNGLSKNYILHVYREVNTNVFLSDLQVKFNGEVLEMTPEFNKLLNNYTIEVENEVKAVEIIATAEEPTKANVHITDTSSLVVGSNSINVFVTDNTASGDVNIYNINIIRKKNNNPKLAHLEVEGYQFTEEFDPDVHEYDVNVLEDATSLNVKAIPEVDTTNVSIKGHTNIVDNYTTITVTTLAENKTEDIYYIHVYRNLSNNNDLKMINVDDEELVGFSKDKTSYEIKVPYEKNTINIEGILDNKKASVDGNGEYAIDVGENIIVLTVTSEMGETKEYTLKVIKDKDTNVDLLRVENNRGSAVTSDASGNYVINVQNEIDSIEIKGIAASPNATVTGNRYYYNLEVGDNNFTLRVTAEDNVTYKDYNVIVVRDKSKNDDLKFLYVHEGGLNPVFNETTIVYEVMVPNNVEIATIEAITEDKKATYEILNNGPLVEGEMREVIVRVTAEAGNTKDYVLNITRQKATEEDLTLLSLTTDRGDLTPEFSPLILNYELTVEHEISDITVRAEATSDLVKVLGEGTYNLRVGKNAIAVFVVGLDGVQRDYQIVITRKASNDATLANLVVKNHNLVPGFSKETLGYSLTTSNDYLDFTTIKTTEKEATYKIIDNENFEIGNNIVMIEVTAPDAETTMTYVINVTKEANKNNNLASLEVVGYQLTPTFHKGVTYYTVDIPNEVNSINIRAKAEDKTASIVGMGIQKVVVGTNTFQVVVTAQNGKNKIYTIVATKDGSSNNYLSDLYTNQGDLTPEFNKEELEYTINVDASVESIDVRGTTENANAIVTGFGEYTLEAGNNEIEIVVTSESGEVRIYKVVVIKSEKISANIKDLDVEDYELDEEFNPEIVEYYLTVNNETTSLNLNVVLEDKDATYEVQGNENFVVGMNEVHIVVTAKDNVTTKTYTLYVSRSLSTNNYLSYLSTSEGVLDPVFNKETLEYRIEVPREVSSINVEAYAEDASATITSGVGTKSLVVGENTIQVKVKSSIGVYRTYILKVMRKRSDNAYLSSLTVKAGADELSFNEVFNKEDNNYTMVVDSSITELQVLATKESQYASVSGVGIKPIYVGENILEVVVTAEDKTENKYTIKVTREADSNNQVTSIVPSVGDLNTTFDPGIHEYDLLIPAEENVLSFVVSPVSNKATVTGEESLVITQDAFVRVIKIISESGEENVYTFKVTRESQAEARLESLKLEGYAFEFDPDVFTYNIKVALSKKSVLASDIIAIPKDKDATVNLMGDLNLAEDTINVYVIEVIAKDSYTTQEYRLNITRDSEEYTLRTKTYDINRNNDEDYVIGIMPSTNIDDFKLNFDNEQELLHVYMNDVEASGLTATAMEIRLEKDGFVYDKLRVIVRGDLTSDGRVNVTDQVKLINYVGKVGTLDKYQMLAADLTFDSRVNVTDQVKLINYVGKVITNQDLNPKKEEEGS